MARLIDSSLWVDFTRRRSPTALKLRIQPWILDPDAALCQPVAFEVLRHATAEERGYIAAQFGTLPQLATPADIWSQATSLGQTCRDHGITPGSMDLIIAALALYHKAELITFDTDFLPIADVSSLQVNLLRK